MRLLPSSRTFRDSNGDVCDSLSSRHPPPSTLATAAAGREVLQEVRMSLGRLGRSRGSMPAKRTPEATINPIGKKPGPGYFGKQAPESGTTCSYGTRPSQESIQQTIDASRWIYLRELGTAMICSNNSEFLARCSGDPLGGSEIPFPPSLLGSFPLGRVRNRPTWNARFLFNAVIFMVLRASICADS